MFGTLADTASVAVELARACGDGAGDVAAAWRVRQLEYMFRVTAMSQFPPFADLTRWSLASALAEFGFSLPPSQIGRLAGAYRRLRPYADARPALTALRELAHQVVVLSVGPKAWLEELASSYRDLVDDLVTAEQAGGSQPHHGTYRHLLTVRPPQPAPPHAVPVN